MLDPSWLEENRHKTKAPGLLFQGPLRQPNLPWAFWSLPWGTGWQAKQKGWHGHGVLTRGCATAGACSRSSRSVRWARTTGAQGRLRVRPWQEREATSGLAAMAPGVEHRSLSAIKGGEGQCRLDSVCLPARWGLITHQEEGHSTPRQQPARRFIGRTSHRKIKSRTQ